MRLNEADNKSNSIEVLKKPPDYNFPTKFIQPVNKIIVCHSHHNFQLEYSSAGCYLCVCRLQFNYFEIVVMFKYGKYLSKNNVTEIDKQEW